MVGYSGDEVWGGGNEDTTAFYHNSHGFGVCLVERYLSSWLVTDSSGDWFGDRLVRRLGNGDSILFSHDTWVGLQPLSRVFPRLFLVSNLQEGCVANFGGWVDGVWSWRLVWRRNLFVWEEDLVRDLLLLLQPLILNSDANRWEWVGDVSGVYSVRSAYACLTEESLIASGFSDDQMAILGRLWQSLALPKVISFSWQLLLDRVPTRVNLVRRGVILDEEMASSILCGGDEESTLDLFMRCPFAQIVWYDVFRWLGWQLPMPPDLFSLFVVFCASTRDAQAKRGLSLIWHSVLCFFGICVTGVFSLQKHQIVSL